MIHTAFPRDVGYHIIDCRTTGRIITHTKNNRILTCIVGLQSPRRCVCFMATATAGAIENMQLNWTCRLERCDVCARYYDKKTRTCRKITAPCHHPLLYELHGPGPGKNRQCALLTQCQPTGTPSTEETIAPTATSDRACGPRKSKCKFGDADSEEYRVGEPLQNGERQCRAVTKCTKDEYEMVPPTLTSNRICGKLAVCGARSCVGKTCPCSENCHACILVAGATFYELASTSICTTCKNGGYLFEGRCHRSCEAFPNVDAVGSGKFGRRCGAPLPSRYMPEYELAPATPTSNRICRPFRPLQSEATFVFNCNTASRTQITHNQNGATSGFEMCFVPGTLGAGPKTRLESCLTKF